MKTPGPVEARKVRKGVRHQGLRHVRMFVRVMADASHDAPWIIERSGVAVKRSSGHRKADFELDAVTCTLRRSTVRADTVIPNHAPRTRYLFRFRRVTKDGVGDWSHVVSVLVF